MAYTLKLDIYYFSLNKIIESRERKTKVCKKIGYKIEKENSKFKDVIESFTTQGNDDFMKTFIEDFINGFNSSFKSSKTNTQAISITTNLLRNFDSKKFVIWGVFKGGQIGINREIYQSNDANNIKDTIHENDVTSLYYFYKIWFPKDSNIGILIIQSYTSLGCSALFKEQLSDYFISKGYKPNWTKFVPQEYIKKYLKDGYLNELQIIHSKKDENTPLAPIFKPFQSATRKSVFSKFQIALSDILSLPNYKKILNESILAVDTEYNESRDCVKLFYTSNGTSAHTTLAKIEKILPTIILDDELKNNDTQLPKWEELNRFTNDMLENIKKQIGYTPKQLK